LGGKILRIWPSHSAKRTATVWAVVIALTGGAVIVGEMLDQDSLDKVQRDAVARGSSAGTQNSDLLKAAVLDDVSSFWSGNTKSIQHRVVVKAVLSDRQRDGSMP
jgi:hypothetical protein